MTSTDLIADVINRYSDKVSSISGQVKAASGVKAELDELVKYGWFGVFDTVKDLGCSGRGFDQLVSRRIKRAVGVGLNRVGIDNNVDSLVFQATWCTRAHVLKSYPGYLRVVEQFGFDEDVFFYVAGLVWVCGLSSIQMKILAAGGYKTLDVPITGVNDDTRTALVTAIEKLDPLHKLILGLKYEQGLDLKQISAVLDMRRSVVHQAHDKAVHSLSESLRVG